MDIKEIIKDLEATIIDYRRDFHKHPELGFEEKRTSKIIAKVLNDLGFEVKRNVAKTGVVGLLKGVKPGPTIALRADMDALPIQEKTGLPFASQEEGKMHACGHDGHMSILLGTAMVLAQIRNKINGNIKFIFQPAEEGPGGAKPMIEENVLSNPDVDAIFGLHMAHDVDAGKIGVKEGAMFASIDEIDITIKGNSSHGARPHEGKDAVLIAADLVNSLQNIVSREIDPNEAAVITIGKIEGGYRRNVIADKVELEGTVRCVNPEVRRILEERIKNKIKGVSNSYGVEINVDYRNMYPSLINDPEKTKLLRTVAVDVLGTENVEKTKKPTMGGEDFAYFLKEVPGCYFWLGGRNVNDERTHASKHNPYFTFDESVLKYGVEILSRTVIKASEV